MKCVSISAVCLAALTLSACSVEGTRTLNNPNEYIAVAADLGRDSGAGTTDNAGIAVTPDGCQAWLIDDGVDGRASNRLDPVTGLPVCIGEPGVVYGAYQSSSEGVEDRVPGEALPTTTRKVTVRNNGGYYQTVHPVETPHNH